MGALLLGPGERKYRAVDRRIAGRRHICQTKIAPSAARMLVLRTISATSQGDSSATPWPSCGQA
jgi:hypothetical protein